MLKLLSATVSVALAAADHGTRPTAPTTSRRSARKSTRCAPPTRRACRRSSSACRAPKRRLAAAPAASARRARRHRGRRRTRRRASRAAVAPPAAARRRQRRECLQPGDLADPLGPVRTHLAGPGGLRDHRLRAAAGCRDRPRHARLQPGRNRARRSPPASTRGGAAPPPSRCTPDNAVVGRRSLRADHRARQRASR